MNRKPTPLAKITPKDQARTLAKVTPPVTRGRQHPSFNSAV